ncbi:hypothetical protein MYL51_05515 [Escherichia coli]|uniref:hypothetical protein n=1 Tax=Escherichia coli TaxID=562 RepID=UPI0023B27CF9|nr:hypothetical protein [Escherichia coli]MDF0474633.1 hypothetical protein [Escherichia coli]MDY7516497.1 hypothetical protein [Escherichia coli]
MMSLWDALRMNMMISYQELVRTFLSFVKAISTATGFELYINEKKVATFNPSAKNVKKVMDNNFIQSCWNTWYE